MLQVKIMRSVGNKKCGRLTKYSNNLHIKLVTRYYCVTVLKYMCHAKSKSEESKITIGLTNTVILLDMLDPVFIFGSFFTPIVNQAKNLIALLGF